MEAILSAILSNLRRCEMNPGYLRFASVPG
jgi:hypothetical protein